MNAIIPSPIENGKMLLLFLYFTLEKNNHDLHKPESPERMKKGLILFTAHISLWSRLHPFLFNQKGGKSADFYS